MPYEAQNKPGKSTYNNRVRNMNHKMSLSIKALQELRIWNEKGHVEYNTGYIYTCAYLQASQETMFAPQIMSHPARLLPGDRRNVWT